MSEFRISVSLSALIPWGGAVTADMFPHLAHAVRTIAEAAHRQWVAYASGMPLPSGKVISSRTGEYARSIQLRQTGPFSAEVYSALPYARAIEEGTPARDLKRMLNSSFKVRVSAKGKRYLIIPFRWNTPNSVLGRAMPQAVHDWWQAPTLARSAIVGTYRRVSGTGAMSVKTRDPVTVAGWKYRWGSRLTPDVLEALGITGPAAKRMAGMVNFRKPNARGGAAHSKFLTFRVMVEGSSGWVVPAQEGRWPARTVAQQLAPVAEQAFRRAMEEDVKRMMGAEASS
ncbi:hypothetical protein UFOVP326_15 [uncultured Caudovirales phage]|uniref:Uncharacterized protein n=1 Tax=uncultured Caudovirales phage TaxID=2100421 RepID=A0A6J5LVX8_9CAUD|nr:hypothetical protein UFOVP326_15 [uncultured Caudovirales phage]